MSNQRIVALMGLVAASLAVMSTLHLTGVLGDGGTSSGPSRPGIAEALIFVALTVGAVALARARPAGRRTAVATVCFAIFGFLIGLRFTTRGGDPVDLTYHVTVMPLLLLTLWLLVRRSRMPRAAPQ
jgi:hypothetical protein